MPPPEASEGLRQAASPPGRLAHGRRGL